MAFVGLTEMEQGNYWRGRSTVLDALELANQVEHPTASGVVHVVYGYILFSGGEYELCIEQARAVEHDGRKMEDHVWIHMAHGMAARALNRISRHEQAKAEHAKQDSYFARLGGNLNLADWFAPSRAEVAMAMGDLESACDLAETSISFARSSGGVYAEGLAERVWGRALGKVASKYWDEAKAHLDASLRLFENENARLEAARTRLALGELFASCDLSGACDSWSQAAANFASKGLERDLALAQTMLRKAE